MNKLIKFLSDRLDKTLPGRKAQKKMAPKPVTGGEIRQLDPPKDVKRSSVLALLFSNEDGELELVLTLRTEHIDHGGQISFPGGRAHEGESPVATALREAKEEIGVNPDFVQIIGQLSDLYVSHSNNLVIPVVGYSEKRPDFQVNPNEVKEVFAVELKSLLHKKNLTVEDWDLRSHTYKVPYWNIHRVPLWGATAMMLNELLELTREYFQDQ